MDKKSGINDEFGYQNDRGGHYYFDPPEEKNG